MAVSDKPWSGFSAASYRDTAAYCAACLVDATPAGQDPTQANCHLPVFEPGGALNRNGAHAAAARLAGAGGGVSSLNPAQRRTAARKLVALYRQLDEDPPESLRRLAGG